MLDWQRVVEIGSRLLTKQDMKRFGEMCKDGLLGGSNYVIFKDWSAIDWSREGYLHIRDRLVLEGEVQEMNNEENGPYEARLCAFFLAYHQVLAYCQWLSFHPTESERYRKFEVSLERVIFFAHSLTSFVLMDRNFSFGTHIRQA
jgi:hypothetical protein